MCCLYSCNKAGNDNYRVAGGTASWQYQLQHHLHALRRSPDTLLWCSEQPLGRTAPGVAFQDLHTLMGPPLGR